MKKISYSLSLLICLIGSLTAQINNNQNNPIDPNSGGGIGGANKPPITVKNSVEKFKSSDFMVRFNDFKTQMETDVRDFIGRQNSYSVKDVRRVQMSYDQTAAKFNTIMLEIKQDFMDRDKVKMINKFPDMYANGLKGKMDGLEDFYRANFNQTLESVTEAGGSVLLLALVDLVKLAGELSQHFKSLKYERESMNDQYLQQNLVDPYKLPTWSQLLANTPIKTDVKIHPTRPGGSSSDINNNNGTGNNNNGSGNNNNGSGNNNNGTGNNNNGTGNGNDNSGGNNNGGGNENPNNGGTKRQPQNTTEVYIEKGNNPNEAENGAIIGVEGQSTVRPKTAANQSNTEGIKKRPKPNNNQ